MECRDADGGIECARRARQSWRCGSRQAAAASRRRARGAAGRPRSWSAVDAQWGTPAGGGLLGGRCSSRGAGRRSSSTKGLASRTTRSSRRRPSRRWSCVDQQQFPASRDPRLEQQKKLKTADTLDKFPRRRGQEGRHRRRDLLDHTSGLSPNSASVRVHGAAPDQYVEQCWCGRCREAGRSGRTQVGYALLAAIVEVVTKGTFEDYPPRSCSPRWG